MVLRNWYNLMKANRTVKVISGGYTNTSGTVHDAACYGTSEALGGLALRANAVTLSTGSLGICLGAGTTPPSIDDYKLEKMITSGLSCVLATTMDADKDVVYTITATNITDADIVVGEVGIIVKGYRTASNNPVIVLAERTVLDSPITIAAGGVGVIIYTLKQHIPEA